MDTQRPELASGIEGECRMAIYHLSIKPVSRGRGRSATAAAAYRSGELVQDLTSGEGFDYTRRRGVEHTEIVLPTAAAKLDINWARDRESLWNAAELAEQRKDARVAREYEVALPHELNAKQRTELVRAFASDIANRYGVAVDFAVHKPHRSGDERNHHAHIMATTREVTATGFGAKAAIEWSDTDRAKRGLSAAKVEVKVIRARWADLTNEHLKDRGLEIRVDHRTLESQGINREPTTHLGPAVSALERRGIETEVGKRIAWQRQAAAQERLERAAELGKIEREKESLERSILDLSGDLNAARKGRAVAPSSAAELSSKQGDPAARARENWLRSREAQANKGQTVDDLQREGREDWLKYRELVAKGDSSAQERALVAMEFQRLAKSRAANQEREKDWEATPKKLRDAIERYNRESPEIQQGILKGIVMRPEAAKVIQEGIQARREQLDRGPSLEL